MQKTFPDYNDEYKQYFPTETIASTHEYEEQFYIKGKTDNHEYEYTL